MKQALLSVSGFDNTGGAGILADTRAASLLGAHCVGALSCVTVQGAGGPPRVEKMSPETFFAQLKAAQKNFSLGAVKIGLFPDKNLLEPLIVFLRETKIPTVVDPVFSSSLGGNFAEVETYLQIQKQLVEHSILLTPNLKEAEILLDLENQSLLAEVNSSKKNALLQKCRELGLPPIVIKGGHDHRPVVRDLLLFGTSLEVFESPRLDWPKTRGTGCTFSTAVTVFLMQGMPLIAAVEKAGSFTRKVFSEGTEINGFLYSTPAREFKSE